MRFLHLADLHLGSSFANCSETTKAAFQVKLWRYLDELLQDCEKRQVDLLFLAGDVLEPTELSEVNLQRLIALLQRPRNFYIAAVAGNHDPLLLSSPWQKIKARVSNFHLFGEECETLYFPAWQVTVSGVSFADFYLQGPLIPDVNSAKIAYIVEKKDNFTETPLPLAELHKVKDTCRQISLVHASPCFSPAFSRLQAEAADDYAYNQIGAEDVAQAACDYLALGHFHKPIIADYSRKWQANFMADKADTVMYQAEYKKTANGLSLVQVAAGDSPLPVYGGTLPLWPGNFCGRNFGENGFRGAFFGEFQGDRLNLQWETAPLPCYYQLQVELEQLQELFAAPADDLPPVWQVAPFYAHFLPPFTASGTPAAFRRDNIYKIVFSGRADAQVKEALAELINEIKVDLPECTIEDNSCLQQNWENLCRHDSLAQRLYNLALKKYGKTASEQPALQIAWQALAEAKKKSNR